MDVGGRATQGHAYRDIGGRAASGTAAELPERCILRVTGHWVFIPTGNVAANPKYVHTDHLNTPRLLTNWTGAIGWIWQSDPFGAGVPTVIASYASNYYMGLPGMYVDAETGHLYNYFRHYNAGIGRYYESDPIGLGGGINTYAYAAGNPIKYIDQYGLDIFIVEIPPEVFPPELIPRAGMTPEQYDNQIAQFEQQQMASTSAMKGSAPYFPVEAFTAKQNFWQAMLNGAADWLSGGFLGSFGGLLPEGDNLSPDAGGDCPPPKSPPPPDFDPSRCIVLGQNVCT